MGVPIRLAFDPEFASERGFRSFRPAPMGADSAQKRPRLFGRVKNEQGPLGEIWDPPRRHERFRDLSGFRLWPVEAGGVPGPHVRGTGGTLVCGLQSLQNWGHFCPADDDLSAGTPLREKPLWAGGSGVNQLWNCCSSATTAAILSSIWFQPSNCPLFFALSMGSFPMKVSFVWPFPKSSNRVTSHASSMASCSIP